jgi:hypothetical protein
VDELVEDREQSREHCQVVRAALAELRPRHRQLLVAAHLEEATYTELAMREHIEAQSVRRVLVRARSSFRRAYEQGAKQAGLMAGAVTRLRLRVQHRQPGGTETVSAALPILAVMLASFAPGGSPAAAATGRTWHRQPTAEATASVSPANPAPRTISGHTPAPAATSSTPAPPPRPMHTPAAVTAPMGTVTYEVAEHASDPAGGTNAEGALLIKCDYNTATRTLCGLPVSRGVVPAP